jgi:tryptophan synthase beta chain
MITKSEPDEQGHWGKFGGRYVPETLVAPLEELTSEFMRARDDPNFWQELNLLLRDYAGRPTPAFHSRRLTAAPVARTNYLKRAKIFCIPVPKINNNAWARRCARRMGKHRVIARDRRRPARRRNGNCFLRTF